MIAFLVGAVLGFIGSIPIAGPIAAIVLSQALAGRARVAWFTAFGAAFAEATYACLAFLGFANLLTPYPWIATVSRIAAAVVLSILAVMFWRAKPPSMQEAQNTPLPKRQASTKRSFFFGLSITALNPTLLATWAATVTMLYSLEWFAFTSTNAFPFAAGVLVGISTWALAFVRTIGALKARASERAVRYLLRGTAIFVGGLALWFASQAVRAQFF